MKMNIVHKKHKCLKVNLLTKCSHNNDEVHTLNSIVAQKRQQQRSHHYMQTQLYLFNFSNNEMSPFHTSSLLPQATDKLLLTDLIENACSVTVAASLISQNIIFTV